MCPFKTSFLQWTTFVMWYRCCHAARLIKARRIFVAVLIDNEPSCPRACNIKTEAVFANWLAPKHGALFTLGHSAYITFRIIMSFRKPCHMPHAIPQLYSTFYLHRKVFHLLWRRHSPNKFQNSSRQLFKLHDRIFSFELLELHLRCKKKLYNSLSVYVTLFYIAN